MGEVGVQKAHAVTGRCAGASTGMDACLSPCGDRSCPVSCCDEHRARYGPPNIDAQPARTQQPDLSGGAA